MRDGQLGMSPAALAWIERSRGRFTAVIDGVKYTAEALGITGSETRPGEYSGQVRLAMMDKGSGKIATLAFDFTYVPGADAGMRLRDTGKISVTPLEVVAYVTEDGRMSIDAGTVVDLGPFSARVDRTVGLDVVADPTAAQPIYLELVIEQVTDPTVAEWRGQPVTKGAAISGEFQLRPLRQAPELRRL